MSISEQDVIKIRQRLDRVERKSGIAGGVFVARQNPVWDKTLADINGLALAGTWYDLNLAAIIPAQTKSILIRCTIMAAALDRGVAFTPKTGGGIDAAAFRVPVANSLCDVQGMVFTGGLQTIQWQRIGVSVSSFNMSILGWWI
ncbi:MAG: hypothetical protein Q7T18_12635 [Sedimentisphaerales bacterium]|nr:hypothetical protein [Sedimentisphaerales bacterium]